VSITIRTHGFISTEQCTIVACKASRAANCIRRSFSYGSRKLLWPAFQAYVLPTSMFCALSWAPCLLRDIDVIEKVQRRYTKTIHGLHDLPYDKRLQELGALTLANRRTYADMTSFQMPAWHDQLLAFCSRANGSREQHTQCRAPFDPNAYRQPSSWCFFQLPRPIVME
jgi:hypothetical protein